MLFPKVQALPLPAQPLIEVICQLRFPTILSIGYSGACGVQEAIRHEFPQFVARQERPAPQDHRSGHPPPTPRWSSSPHHQL